MTILTIIFKLQCNKKVDNKPEKLSRGVKNYIKLFSKTIKQWLKDDAFQQSAVIAYYTLFSLPSLLVIVISIAGYFYGKSNIQDEIMEEIGRFIGMETAQSLGGIVSNVNVHYSSTLAIVISVLILFFGATGAFFQLKKAMNKIWGVRTIKANILQVVFDRLISLGMVLTIGFMMVISLVVTTVVTALGQYIGEFAPQLTSAALKGFNFLFSYIFIGFLFAAVFKLLPDIKIRWKVTFIGASITTVLFLVAEYGISVYLSTSDPTSVFGGASSVILIMLWVYYSCLIMFFGAEFTVQYAIYKKENISPNRFSEPAFIQEIKELKEKKLHLKERQKILDELTSDSFSDE